MWYFYKLRRYLGMDTRLSSYVRTPDWPTPVRYTIAVVAALGAGVLRGVLSPIWGEDLPFLTFIPAMVLSAWAGGFWPGLLTTVLEPAPIVFETLYRPYGRWFRARVFPTPDGFSVLLEDTTDQKRAEEASLRLAAIVRWSDEAIVGKDLDGIITAWNPAAERLFGFTAQEAIGRSIRMIVPADRQGEEDDVLSRLRRGETVEHFETVRMRKDGTPINVALTVSPIRD